MIAALLRGGDAEAMLRTATAAAAASCTREGAIGGVPAPDDVERYRFSSTNPSGGTVSVNE